MGTFLTSNPHTGHSDGQGPGVVEKKVNCHFFDGGHLDPERLRFSVFGSAPIWNFVGLVIQAVIHSVAAPLDSKNIVYKTQPGQTNSLDWCSI